jgi:hypothetical protein
VVHVHLFHAQHLVKESTLHLDALATLATLDQSQPPLLALFILACVLQYLAPPMLLERVFQ